MKPSQTLALSILAVLLFACSLPAPAEDSDKPFAEAHVVLQLADDDDKTQARVLSVANNLIKHYGGPDFVDIEIVSYGPGISLLYPDNANRERISSLMANDVRFVGCQNTLDTIERATGERPELIADVILVKTGIARVIERAQQDYVVIRP
jgi:intracellular sulfur oxidation DsrE/DsrF family protein